nr:hypothetical protein [Candidatus Sigynarchaeota archaeon]
MTTEMKKVRITCPSCQQLHYVDIPLKIFDHGPDTGIVTVSFKTECGHACQIFIGKDFKVRGGQCADVSLDDISVEPITPEMMQVSELVLKFITEMIKQDIEDDELIQDLNARDKIEEIESLLIHSDVMKARRTLEKLRKFAIEIGELEFASKMSKRIERLERLMDTKPGFDWDSIIIEDISGTSEQAFARARALHYERLRQILADLEYNAIEEALPRDVVNAKKARLVELVDRED